MKRLRMGGEQLPRRSEIKAVGVKIAANPDAGELSCDRFSAARAVAKRVAWAPLPFEIRVAVLETMVLPKCLYGCSAFSLSSGQLHHLTQDILKALHGGKLRHCAEITITIFARGHLLDPRQASAFQRLIIMKQMLDRRADLQGVFCKVWHAKQHSRRCVRGPVRLLI